MPANSAQCLGDCETTVQNPYTTKEDASLTVIVMRSLPTPSCQHHHHHHQHLRSPRTHLSMVASRPSRVKAAHVSLPPRDSTTRPQQHLQLRDTSYTWAASRQVHTAPMNSAGSRSKGMAGRLAFSAHLNCQHVAEPPESPKEPHRLSAASQCCQQPLTAYASCCVPLPASGGPSAHTTPSRCCTAAAAAPPEVTAPGSTAAHSITTSRPSQIAGRMRLLLVQSHDEPQPPPTAS